MAGVGVLDPDEIYLGGYYLPTVGPVRITNITVTPNPVLFGDTSKQGDSQVMSSFVQSSNTGGSGIYKANPRTDVDRFWSSKADTRFRGLFTLPPLTTDMGKPAGLTSEAVTSCLDYRNEQYFAWANKVYRWLNSTSTWSASERTLLTTPSDAIVFNDLLFYAYTTAYDYRNSAGVWATVAQPANFWALWDTKLWRLANVSGVWTIYSSANGTTWGAAEGTLPAGVTPHQMMVYRDSAGENVIIVVTDVGLWMYDAANDRFLQSEVRIPRMVSTQVAQAAVFRDSKLYMNSGGLGMLSVQAGNPFVVTPMGLDLEDGVPSTEDGVIDAVAADFNWILALIHSVGTSDEDDRLSGLSGPFDTIEWSSTTGTALLRAWNQGWHTLWQSASDALSDAVLAVSSAYDLRRVYICANQGAVYQDIPTSVYNPRHNTTATYAAGPVQHITPWFDYGSEVQQKILGHFQVRTTRCTSTEKVTIYYATDLDDVTWTLLGEITSNGLATFRPGGVGGTQCRFVRFRFDLQRGGDTTAAPLVEFWSSEFMRLLPAAYGYAVELDLSDSYKDQTPMAMLDIIKNLSDPATTPNLIQFSYQDAVDGSTRTHYARVSRLTGQEWGGEDRRGKGNYTLSVMVPYKDDSLVGG
jgi:hypothetical protein